MVLRASANALPRWGLGHDAVCGEGFGYAPETGLGLDFCVGVSCLSGLSGFINYPVAPPACPSLLCGILSQRLL